ncbi:MAG TPA: NAD(P)-dependent alcohol dehydrogenase [Thermoanaerobaculia bacterium]|nr:NAD(P)-dependent alcohol dehydrogenase [Thermoanaerobaculia bacterium]
MTAPIPAWAAPSAKAPLVPHPITRREPGPRDVQIEILYCGVCHSDIHQARNEWADSMPSVFPMVPGHEIVGRVTKVGADVSKFAVGDVAGVGCFVDSCHECNPCRRHLEQFCLKGAAFTYNSTEMDRKTPTYGGYSTQIVVTERYALKVPPGLELAAAAPLLCAGITTYSPLRHWKCAPGQSVGVVGLGGLGHMAVKLAASMGAEVTMLSTSRAKEADARRLGAHAFELTSDVQKLRKLAGRFDLLIDTISAEHDLNTYLGLLKPEGAMVCLGAPPKPAPLAMMSLIYGSKTLAGSMIGGIAETQEMLDYCASKKITADVEMIPIEKINEAYERMLTSDVRYRFVIDIASLKGS